MAKDANSGKANRMPVMAWHSTPERESLVTVQLKPDGAGTLLTFHHEQFFDVTARDNHERGWTDLFVNLEKLLA